MKLCENTNELAKYYTKSENYYYYQAEGVEQILEEKGFEVEQLTYNENVRIYGNIAESLGYQEGMAISENSFKNCLNGNNIHGDKITKEKKVKGIDLTFSAPKTVSISGLVTIKDERIIEAHDKAVLETMKEVEALYSYTRLTQDSRQKSEGMAYAVVRDGLNRDNDPHLHTHVVLFNLTKFDNKFFALDGKQIMQRNFNKLWGSMYRTKLKKYIEDLGYETSYTKDGMWRMEEVAHEIELEFSQRRLSIQEAKSLGLNDFEAWQKTRQKKQNKLDKNEIKENWNNRVLGKEKSIEQTQNDSKNLRESFLKDAVFSLEAKQDNQTKGTKSEITKWLLAVERATEKKAVIGKKEIFYEYLKEEMKETKTRDLSYSVVEKEFENIVKNGFIPDFKDNKYSSWDIVKAERYCIDSLSNEVKKDTNILTKQEAEKEVKKYNELERKDEKRELSGIQVEAVENILNRKQMITTIQGDAGSGKTTMLRAVNEILKDKYELVGLAMQGVAARKLEDESGIKSKTLVSYLSENELGKLEKNLGHKKELIIFDEASMLDSRNAEKLIKLVEKNDSKIIFVGDENQLSSIQAGDIFHRFVEDSKNAKDLINLNENYRQKDEILREAVECAKQGNMVGSLEILEKQNNINVIEDKETRFKEIAGQYDNETLIIVGTKESKHNLNTLIREDLKAKGNFNNFDNLEKSSENNQNSQKNQKIYQVSEIDNDGLKYIKEIEFARGEKVIFTKNEYKNYDVRNGERGTILELKDNEIKIELEDKREITIDLKKYDSLDYGYVMTTYKAQGQTYNKVVVECDTKIPSLIDMRNQYVNITRAREAVKIYTDDLGDLKYYSSVKSIAKDTLGEEKKSSYLDYGKQKDKSLDKGLSLEL